MRESLRPILFTIAVQLHKYYCKQACEMWLYTITNLLVNSHETTAPAILVLSRDPILHPRNFWPCLLSNPASLVVVAVALTAPLLRSYDLIVLLCYVPGIASHRFDPLCKSRSSKISPSVPACILLRSPLKSTFLPFLDCATYFGFP